MKQFLIRIWNKLFPKEKPNHILSFDPGVDRLHQNDDLNMLLKEAIGITNDQRTQIIQAMDMDSPYCFRCQSYHPLNQPHYDELGKPSFNPFSEKFSEIDETIDKYVVSRLLTHRKYKTSAQRRIR